MLLHRHEALLRSGYEDSTSCGPLLRMSSWHVAESWVVLPLAERKFLWARCQSPTYAIGSRLLMCDGSCGRTPCCPGVLVVVNMFGFHVVDA
jgi:hypothetical protein